jgi:transcriptional regulator with XRE-family HTH domain
MRRRSLRAAAKSLSSSEPAERFARILELRFAGNRSAFAKALGCSPSFVSRVVAGKKQPGSKLLLALADLPGLNRRWALTGEGEPSATTASENAAIPVVDHLLPGPPPKHQEMLTGERRGISEAEFSKSRYFLRLTPAEPFLATPENPQIQAGDLLLMECELTKWRKTPELLGGRVCAIRRTTPGSPSIRLARLKFHRPKTRRSPTRDPVTNRPLRQIQLDEGQTSHPEESEEAETEASSGLLTFQDIEEVVRSVDVLAVAILLVRNM